MTMNLVTEMTKQLMQIIQVKEEVPCLHNPKYSSTYFFNLFNVIVLAIGQYYHFTILQIITQLCHQPFGDVGEPC